MARLTAMFASNDRRIANTAQRIATRSQNGPVRAVGLLPRAREAANASTAQVA
jgi:hypothetical protein